MSLKVFISYRTLDLEFAQKLQASLKAQGLDTWFDKVNIAPGDSWQEAIEKGLSEATHLVVLLTPESVKSREVTAEWSYFLDEKKPIIPLLVQPCAIPYRLRLLQHIDFTSAFDPAFSRLIERINASHAAIVNPLPSEHTPAAASAHGLSWANVARETRSFTRKKLIEHYSQKFDADYYSIRAGLQAHYTRFLASNKSVMVVTGKAGTGKSNFICGLTQTEDPNTVIWLQNCVELETYNLSAHLTHSIGVADNLHEVFGALYAETPAVKFVALFDAVNEHKNPDVLLKELAAFARTIDDIPNFKIIITCRIPIWNTLKDHFEAGAGISYHAAGPNSYVSIDSFDEQDLEAIYERYRQVYKLKSTYAQLSPQVREFISKPLFLKLTAEVYFEKEIPGSLPLGDVFKRFIEKSLGKDGMQGDEFKVLYRVVELMYQHAQRELSAVILREDSTIGHYISQVKLDKQNPYLRLIDEGLLTEHEVDETMLRRIEKVFITYELVFEYLLSEVVIGAASTEAILKVLDEATRRSFPQLRGAAELAFSLAVIKKRIGIAQIVAIAGQISTPEQRRGEIHQFIINVIQIIADSGERTLSEDILIALSKSNEYAAKIMAVQGAYQLKYDGLLAGLALSSNAELKDTAAIYLYERWNQARKEGKLDEAYKIVQTVANNINLRNVRRIGPAVSTLLSLTFNLSAHIIDAPESVIPLVGIYQNIVRKVPGLEPRNDRQGLLSFISENMANILIDAASSVIGRLMQSTIINNNTLMHDLFTSPKNKQIVMEVCNFIDLDTLVGYEEALYSYITVPNPMISWLYRGVFLHFVYIDPETHIPILEDFFYRDGLAFPIKLDLAYSLAFGSVFRLMRGKDIDLEVLEILEPMFFELWEDFSNRIEAGDDPNEPFFISIDAHFNRMEALLTGIFSIEALLQERESSLTGSEFVRGLVAHPLLNADRHFTQMLLHGLEKFSYSSRPQFALLSIFDERVRYLWETYNRDAAIEVLSKVRAFYQDEVDAALKKCDPSLREEVLLRGAIPKVEDVRSIINSLWTASSAVDRTVMKVTGMIAFGMSSSSKTSEFLEHAIRIVISTLFDAKILDTAIAAWFLQHDPTWNKFEKWQIDPALIHEKASVFADYTQIFEAYIREHGKGRVFAEQS